MRNKGVRGVQACALPIGPRRRYLGGGDARWGGAGQIRAAELVREPLAPTVLERRALPEAARALDSRGGPRYGGAARRRPIGAGRQGQGGGSQCRFRCPRYPY